MDGTFSDLQRRAEALAERVDQGHPQSWLPGDMDAGHPTKLVGVLVRVEHGQTRDWGEKKIVVLRDANGEEWGIWLLHTVLLNEFEKARPRIGELVAVKWEGRVERGNGAPYEKYRVVVERPDGADPWLDGEAERPAAPTPETAGHQAPLDVGLCEQCGYRDPEHASGCPESLPF